MDFTIFSKFSISDRNMDQTMGFDSESNPRVWRVYTRKKGKGIKNDDVAQ
jgi:hypothetical protein